MFFIYGHGGTGKTFLWRTLSSSIRSKGGIVLSVASSGIASLLLKGGQTAHSRFAIPLNVNEETLCSIPADSQLAELLRETKLIIWDEAPTMHMDCFEALDRTLNDLLCNDQSVSTSNRFGGKVIVFGGDFRQILPVIPNGSHQEIVNATLNASHLWQHCNVMRLSVNMRLEGQSEPQRFQQVKEFGDWLLKIGDGLVGEDNDGFASIEIPDDMLLKDTTNHIKSIVDFIYPNFVSELSSKTYFEECAILALTNEIVAQVNDYMLSQIPGDAITYLSSDSLCKTENNSTLNQAMYSPDVLNSIKYSGLPDHELKLKVGTPVMLLRNLDQSLGLCNGTRMRITRLDTRIIEAEVISGNNIGAHTPIPRIPLIPTDKKLPFKFKKKQYPLALCFAMTINKSQGQSLSRVGLYLPRLVFSHGQLYVALSRVTTREGIRILISSDEGELLNQTQNIVYKEVLQKI